MFFLVFRGWGEPPALLRRPGENASKEKARPKPRLLKFLFLPSISIIGIFGEFPANPYQHPCLWIYNRLTKAEGQGRLTARIPEAFRRARKYEQRAGTGKAPALMCRGYMQRRKAVDEPAVAASNHAKK